MKLSEAKKLEVEISRCANELNRAIARGVRTGGFVEVAKDDVSEFGMPPCEFVRVSFKIRPDDLEAEE